MSNEVLDEVSVGVDDELRVVGNPWIDTHVLVVGSSPTGYVRVGVVTRSGDPTTVSLVSGEEDGAGDAWIHLRDVRDVERLIEALEDASYRVFSRVTPTPGELVDRAVDVLVRLRDAVTVTRGNVRHLAPRTGPPGEESGTELRRRLGVDSREWAAEFVRTFAGGMVGKHPDEDTLVGWFANAIDAGWSGTYERDDRHKDVIG